MILDAFAVAVCFLCCFLSVACCFGVLCYMLLFCCHAVVLIDAVVWLVRCSICVYALFLQWVLWSLCILVVVRSSALGLLVQDSLGKE